MEANITDRRYSDHCLSILHGNYLRFRAGERDRFVNDMRELLVHLDEPTARRLLSGFWRDELVGAWLIGVKKWAAFVPLIGNLLLQSKTCYAGQGYCFALARVANDDCVRYLGEYLDRYLARPDLVYDQDWAMSALLWCDKSRNEAAAQEYLRESGLWQTFLSKSAMGGMLHDKYTHQSVKDSWLKGTSLVSMMQESDRFCEEWFRAA